MENWLPIKIWKDNKFYDFTGIYEVSDEGRVRSLDRVSKDSKGRKRFFGGLIRQAFTDKDGYELVSLWNNGKGGIFKVHRLVATAFIPNPDNLPLINHKDENTANNKVDNLEWCDSAYNTNYGSARSKMAEALKRNYTPERREAKSKLAEKEVGFLHKPIAIEQIDPLTGEVVAEYPSIAEACRQMHSSHIWQAVSGRRNVACGYKWIKKYSND